MRVSTLLVRFMMVLLSAGASASPRQEEWTLPPATIAHADFSNPLLWLCRPGLRDDKCKVDLDATVINGNGETSIESYVAAADPKIDCFYVYPTVSLDQSWRSDWIADRMEAQAVHLQFARFGSVCRQYAPIYRQVTLAALRSARGGPPPEGERLPDAVGGYHDVVDAWNWYMANQNRGRGVILIGHSQGAGVLSRLLANDIEGKAAQAQFISAMIPGSSVMIAPGKLTGGTFTTIPLCTSDQQFACIISYATYRNTLAPTGTARFGRARDGQQVACTNPASLAGGEGTTDAYFLARGFLNGSGGNAQPAWADPEPVITTTFVKTPRLISTRCRFAGKFSYLELRVNADPADARTDEIAGEIVRGNVPDPDWGLHLIDIDHSIGDLVRIAGRQAEAWIASRSAAEAD